MKYQCLQIVLAIADSHKKQYNLLFGVDITDSGSLQQEQDNDIIVTEANVLIIAFYANLMGYR